MASEKTQWYYVENQERKGPVTFAAIQKLAGQNVVNEQTLVWKEGMKDWQPANKVPGLFDRQPNELPKINVGSSSSAGKFKTARPPGTPVEKASKPKFKTTDESALSDQHPAASPVVQPSGQSPIRVTPQTGSGSTDVANPSANAPVQPTANPVQPISPIAPAGSPADPAASNFQISTNSESRGGRAYSPGNFLEKIQFAGYPCLIAGFLLVIGSKGCDSLGNRWASRLNANSQIAEAEFKAKYDRQKNSLQFQIDRIQQSDNPNAQRIAELNQQISKLNREQSEARQELMKTTWFELNVSARMAQANNQAWGFFRELVFVLGSMVLSVGLLVLGITGNSSEKWTCLIMLAIITFSIYIGGLAWLSSIVGNAVPGRLGL